MSDQALDDIHWISNRFQGLLSLAKDMESYDALKNQKTEMSNTIGKMKTEISDLQEEIALANKSKKDAEEEVTQVYKKSDIDYDQTVARAKADADTIRQNAEADAQSLREAATADMSATNAKIADAKVKLKDLTDKIETLTNTHNRLQSDIDAIKARF